eukprot:9189127-Alexandrium_andersonii.AAC.1
MGLLEVAPERLARDHTDSEADLNTCDNSNIKLGMNINRNANLKTHLNTNSPGKGPPSGLRLRARSGVGRSGKPASAGVAGLC